MNIEYETFDEAYQAARPFGKRLSADLNDAEALDRLREFGLLGNGMIADAVADNLPDGWYEDARSGNASLYVTYEAAAGEDEDGDTIYRTVKARFADHGECYCSEDISCDPQGVSPAQIVAHLREIYEGE